MKGDITRLTFDPKKHYTSVRMQQGRLQLDADWNEQVDIDNHLRRAQILASLGSENGVPSYNPETQERKSNSFKLTIIDQGKDIQIRPGHLYIRGTLCELELGTLFPATIKESQPETEKLQLEVSSLVIDGRDIEEKQWLEDEEGKRYQIETVDRAKRTLTLKTNEGIAKKIIKLRRLSTYKTQPDYFNPHPPSNLSSGLYFAYIDVWERHITTIEDNSLREIALSLPDTTTRSKTVWQLKLLNIHEAAKKQLLNFVNQIQVTEDKKEAKKKLVDELTELTESTESQEKITEADFKNKFNELTKTDKQREFEKLLTQYNSNVSQEGAKNLRDFIDELKLTKDKKGAKNKLVDKLTELTESQKKVTEEKLSSLKNKFNELINSDEQRKFADLLTQYNSNVGQERDELEENSDKIWKEFVSNNHSRFTEAKMNACALLCDNARTGYQRLENQLYRVEIHQSGTIGDETSPTFKWSRENGSIASSIVGKIEGNTIDIKPSSDDTWSSSQPGQQWIEMTNEEQELKGIPGVLALINRVISGTKIEFSNPTPTISKNLTKVRRWDSNEIEIKSQEWIDLEGGIKVKFSSDLAYKTGDYWLIPARTATNDIEWPNDNGEPARPISQSPRGITHNYALLGLVTINQKGSFEGPKQKNKILDKRMKFPSLQNSFDKENGGKINGKVTINAKLEVTENVTIADTLAVDKSTNLAIKEGNVAIGSDSHEAELGVTGNVTITDTLAVDKSTNLAIKEGNVAIGSDSHEAELGVTGNVTITDT
ncbi:DUF6519 domain-containing protein, partial [Crocosphaera sp.]|uniref:DUF6519 domain-containing protein n=1 Tax=Crocosphaera sp. TaxID=2729996 RepID=UPI0026120CBC